MKKFNTLLLFVIIICLNANAQTELPEIDYNFPQKDYTEEEFDDIKLFFKEGNTSPVIKVKISPDCKYLATLDNSGEIVIWDINSRSQIMTINGKKDQISTILFTPDGKYLVGSGQPRMFKKVKKTFLFYWDFKTGKVVYRKELKYPIINMHVSPDKKHLYTVGTKLGVQVRDIRNGEVLKRIGVGLFAGNDFVISPDLKYIIFGNEGTAAKIGKHIGNSLVAGITGKDAKEGFIQLRDFETGKNLKELHAGDRENQIFFLDAIFPNDNKIIFVGNFKKGNFAVYNREKDKFKKIKNKPGYNFIATDHSADGKYIYASTTKKFLKFDSETFEVVNEYETNDPVYTIDFSPNGRFLIYGGGNILNKTSNIQIWDYKTDKPLEKFEPKIASFFSATINQKTNSLVVGTKDGQAQIMDLSNGEMIRTLQAGAGEVEVSMSNDGKYIVTAAVDKSKIIIGGGFRYPSVVKIWDALTYEIINTFPDNNFAIISNDSKKVFMMQSGLRSTMRLVNIHDGSIIKEDKMFGTFKPVAFTKDDKQILTYNGANFKFRNTSDFKKEAKGDKIKGFRFLPQIRDIKFNDDKTKILAALSRNLKNTGAAAEWNLDGSINRIIYRTESGEVWSIAENPSKNEIAIGKKKLNEKSKALFFNRTSGELKDSLDNIGLPIMYFNDGKSMISYNSMSKKRIRLIDTKDYELKATYSKTKNKNGYIWYTPGYYYKMTKNARDAVSFLKSGKVYPFEQFDLIYNRPDKIAECMPFSNKKIVKTYYKAYKKRLSKIGITESMLKEDFNAPEIKILNKDQLPIATNDKKVKFKIKTTSDGSKLHKINVWVNNVPIYGSAGFDVESSNKKVFEKVFEVELSGGRNKVQFSALNKDGIESIKATQYIEYTGSIEKPDLYLTAIGVSEYQDTSYNLSYAAKDINDITDYISDQDENYSNIYTYKYTNEEAKVNDILGVKDKLSNSDVDDQVIMYYAGHGLLNDELDYFLAMHNTDFKKPQINSLSIEDFENLVDGIPARKKTIFIDACHSGEIDKEEKFTIKSNIEDEELPVSFRGFKNISGAETSDLGLKNSFELMKETFNDLRRGSGAMIISSAGGGEFAYEGEDWDNGVFTYSVLKGLKTGKSDLNRDGDISVSELSGYVSDNVSKLTGGQQNPTFRRENIEFDYSILKPQNILDQTEEDFTIYTASAEKQVHTPKKTEEPKPKAEKTTKDQDPLFSFDNVLKKSEDNESYFTLGGGYGTSYGGFGAEFQYVNPWKTKLGFHGGFGYIPSDVGFFGFSVGVQAYFWNNLYGDFQFGIFGTHKKTYYFGSYMEEWDEFMMGPKIMVGYDWFFIENIGLNTGAGLSYNMRYDSGLYFAFDLGVIYKL